MSTITEPLLARVARKYRDGWIVCRVCGCTEVEPCEPPCSWHFPDLCDACARVVAAVLEWKQGAHRPSWPALRREVELQEVFRDAELPKTAGGRV